MKFNLPPSENRLVIVVKKSGTSLKQIVKSVIDELPEETRKPFLDTFNAAGDNSMSESNQRHRILNDLAEAIRETHERYSQEQSNDLDEEISALIETLPDLLQDPHMRTEHLLRTVLLLLILQITFLPHLHQNTDLKPAANLMKLIYQMEVVTLTLPQHQL